MGIFKTLIYPDFEIEVCKNEVHWFESVSFLTVLRRLIVRRSMVTFLIPQGWIDLLVPTMARGP